MVFNYNFLSPAITKEMGSLFARILAGGDVVLFSGELGAGKTTFISGISRGLKIAESLSSPSFTILNIYQAKKINKEYNLIHSDLYRLDSINEVLNVGLEEYIYDKNSITLIEWGHKIKDYIKKEYLSIYFDYDLSSENTRLARFESDNRYWDKKLEIFKRILKK